MKNTILKVENLDFKYENLNKIQWKNINFSIEKNQIVCLLGESGIGKSTLLKLIAHELTPSLSGTIQLLNGLKLSNIAFIQQSNEVITHLEVIEHLYLILRKQEHFFTRIKKRNNQIHQEATSLLEMIGLFKLKNNLAINLSGGEKQRLILAMALASKPKLLIMDEPFSALDPATRLDMQDLLLELVYHKKKQLEYLPTVLLVTHDIEEALYLGQEVVLLKKSQTQSSQQSTIINSNCHKIEGIHKANRAIKNSTFFYKSKVYLYNLMYDKEKATKENLELGLIDEITLSQIEKEAKNIMVISSDLEQDLNNPMIQKTVLKNIDLGKQYLYIIPDSKEMRLKAQKLKDLLQYQEKYYKILFFPKSNIMFSLGEILAYDWQSENPKCFSYVQGNEKGLLIRLNPNFIHEIVNLIKSYDESQVL